MHSPWTKTIRVAALLGAAGLLTSCGASTGDDEALGANAQPLAAGSNAQFVSSTIPTTLAPGERRDVQVVMRNTGSVNDGSNTWTVAATKLARISNIWGWSATPVPAPTPINTNATFNFVITAPAAGTYTFDARMKEDVAFGQTVSIPGIVVSAATTPRWGCTYLPGSSTVPTTLTPGESRAVTVVVQNSGTSAWSTTGTYLNSQDTPASLWGQTSAALPSPVAAGGNATFNFTIKAPSTPGTYNLRRQMQNPQVGQFSLAAGCLDVPITVAGANPLNAALVSQDFPTVMAPSETRQVNVVLTNTGTQAWQADGNYRLDSKNSPASLWGTTMRDVTALTNAAANHTFTFSITAPATPGSYNHRWQMRKVSGSDAADFGVLIDVPMTVDVNATPQFNAAVVSQAIPTRITVGKTASFSITMNNSGSSAWTGSNFTLYSSNTPVSLWTTTNSALGAAETVPATGNRVFTFNVKAPPTAGTYESRWQMRQVSGLGYFGQEAITTGIEVTLCGNGAITAGETCDDDNLNNGDGCSDTCQTEVVKTVDLATDTADRTIIGTQSNKLLANVAIGEFTGDTSVDVITGENLNTTPPGLAFRNQGGILRGYSGATFFTGGAETLTVYGAQANDSLGAQGGSGLFVRDVTGDAQGDVVVSAAGADGPALGRSNCGSVYVLQGGAALTGTVDLALATPHAAFLAEIYGPTASAAITVLAVGDLTNDGTNDLVIGMTDKVYIVPGGAGLTGKIDLAAPPAGVQVISGTGIGRSAAVGDFAGTAAPDLLVGSSNFTHTNSECGATWAVFGPITTARDMNGALGSATGPNAVWFGATQNDHLGTAMAVGDVLGSTRQDVIITAHQQRKGGSAQVGAVDIWAGGFANGSTFDLGSGNLPSAIILGADQYDTAGSAVAAGDYNNDGIQDIAVTSPTADGPSNIVDNRNGELKVILGSRSLSGTIDLSSYNPALTIFGANLTDTLGSRNNNLAFADLDGNGTADICVGSPKGGTGGGLTAPGRIDCFH